MPFAFFLMISVSLITPALKASDAFCQNPARVICSQKQIASDIGMTEVGSQHLVDSKSGVQAALRARLAKKYNDEFFQKIPNTEMTVYAHALKFSNWPICYAGRPCRKAVREAVLNAVVAAEGVRKNPKHFASRYTSLRLLKDALAQPLFHKMLVEKSTDERQLTMRGKSKALAETMFNQLKPRFLKKLEEWPIAEPDKTKMLKRLKALRYAGQKNCGDDSELGDLYEDNANYIEETNEVSVCNGTFLASNSMMMFALTIGHEISHSFDPCTQYHTVKLQKGMSRAKTIERPYGEILSCLENKSSRRKAAPAPPLSCNDHDQIGEIFADWSAIEVVPEYIEAMFPLKDAREGRQRFASAEADMCENSFSPGDEHPRTEDRINAILFQRPYVRKLSQCPSTTGAKNSKYCSFQNSSSIERSTTQSKSDSRSVK